LPSTRIEQGIRAVPNFPKPGILFRDITPLLADAAGFADAIEQMAAPLRARGVDTLVAIESRGFLFGAALAHALGAPLQLVRKPGKLPAPTTAVSYALEYGTDRLEMHTDAIASGMCCAIVDDVLATGGTAAAAASLVRALGGEVACLSVLIELQTLGGRARLDDACVPVECVLRY
jgi:adenine phosphoribosyltransferase